MVRLELVTGKETIDITDIIKSIKWSGNYKQVCRKVDFDILSNPYDKTFPKVNIECGHMIRLLENGKELFRGYIMSRNISYNGSTINYMALDGGTYVLRNQLVYNFKKKTAESITKQVCKDLGVSTGTIVSTGKSMDKKFFGVGGYDIIMTAYTNASAKTGKKYMCYMDKGALNVIKKGEVVLNITMEQKANLTESSFSEDISGVVNQVKIYNSDEKLKKTLKNSDEISKFGTFTKVLRLQEDQDADTEGKKALKKIERKATVEGFGDTTCRCGYGVIVKDEYTKLNGLFYIDEDTHIWEDGVYKIKLTLAFENMMHEVNSDTPEQETTGSTSSNGNTSSSGGNSKVVDIAKSKIGNRYVWGATGPSTFDCSGLMVWSYKQIGVSLPRTSRQQSTYGTSVSKSNLQPGDLLFFSTNGTGSVSHVGMYIGGGQMVHAANSRKGIRTDSITSGYYLKNYKGARRVK